MAHLWSTHLHRGKITQCRSAAWRSETFSAHISRRQRQRVLAVHRNCKPLLEDPPEASSQPLPGPPTLAPEMTVLERRAEGYWNQKLGNPGACRTRGRQPPGTRMKRTSCGAVGTLPDCRAPLDSSECLLLVFERATSLLQCIVLPSSSKHMLMYVESCEQEWQFGSRQDAIDLAPAALKKSAVQLLDFGPSRQGCVASSVSSLHLMGH